MGFLRADNRWLGAAALTSLIFAIPARAAVKFKMGKIMKQKVSALSAELKRAAAEKDGK